MACGEGNLFSVYKIDYEEISKHHTIIFNEEDSNYAHDVQDFLLGVIKQSIGQKQRSKIIDVKKGNFKGIIYKTYHLPEWEDLALDLLSDTHISRDECVDLINNTNISYILLYVFKNKIYAMTGGYGNHVIRNYIEKNWGLYLIPKLVQKDAGIIRQLKENSMFGNTTAMSKANRKTTNISLEQDMSKIFRELSVELGREIGTQLGIMYDEEDSINKKTGVILKDSLVIRKRFILSELEKVIRKIEEIDRRGDNFPLGYFLPAKKKGLKSSDLFDKLVCDLLEGKLENFQLVGDDYLDYYMIASEYLLVKPGEGDYYRSNTPITINDIFGTFEENAEKLSRSFLANFLKKWKISAQDGNGNDILRPISVLEAIQGYVEYGENRLPCYIFQGQWYCMDGQYTSHLSEEFNEFHDSMLSESQNLKVRFGLCKSGLSEDDYNNDFFESNSIIVGHKALISNFEIADLIFWDDENVYLMCNKGYFDGNGSRDLSNQIWGSSRYFQNQIQSAERGEFISNWYSQISNLYMGKGKTIPIGLSTFEDLFNKKKVCYIAGYMTGFNKRSRSLYAKYLTVDLIKKMNDSGYKCILMNIE